MEQKIEGKLKMDNLCFSRIEFKRSVERIGEIKIGMRINASYKKIDNKNQIVKLVAEIKGDNNEIELIVEEQAIFELVNAELLEENVQKNILNINSIAIMLPYLRSQIAIVTAQPGLNSIQIPIIDANVIAHEATYIA